MDIYPYPISSGQKGYFMKQKYPRSRSICGYINISSISNGYISISYIQHLDIYPGYISRGYISYPLLPRTYHKDHKQLKFLHVMDACSFVLLRQVFEAEKMTTKRGCYHKKCFACIKCKANLNYSNAIEGPDDEVN